jgi:membrane protease YdiL (CAAX protease family)
MSERHPVKGGGSLDVQQTRQTLAATLIGVLLASFVFALVWAMLRRGRVWPSRWCLLPPWSIGEVLLAIGVVVLIPLAIFDLLQSAGFFRSYYGSNPNPADKLGLVRAGLWVSLFTPLVAATIVVMLRVVSRTRLWQIGLDAHQLLDKIAIAILVCAVMSPAIFGAHYLSNSIYQVFFEQPPTMHPLQQIAAEHSTPVEWILMVAQAVVFAPLIEELVFRGLILPLASRHWWGGVACWGAALFLAIWQVRERTGPLVFALVLAVPMAATFRRKPEDQTWLAHLGNAALFAMMHAGVWPTPIPLLLLALCLGWLRLRTNSLWGPIVLHSLFNSISTVVLLLTISKTATA